MKIGMKRKVAMVLVTTAITVFCSIPVSSQINVGCSLSVAKLPKGTRDYSATRTTVVLPKPIGSLDLSTLTKDTEVANNFNIIGSSFVARIVASLGTDIVPKSGKHYETIQMYLMIYRGSKVSEMGDLVASGAMYLPYADLVKKHILYVVAKDGKNLYEVQVGCSKRD